jgi:fructoselysine-6-P-deglycase FrlB-like protein
VAATKSVTAQMLILRVLSKPVTEREVDELIAAITQTMEITDLSSAVRGTMPGSVVCGGFAGEWIADEIALKFAEMAGRPVVSESVVEYFHGPAGAASPTLAFLDPGDPNSSELVGTENVIRVGPDASFDLTPPAVTDGSLEALVKLVAGQLIVLQWARSLGEDPDYDRGLSKITRTL